MEEKFTVNTDIFEEENNSPTEINKEKAENNAETEKSSFEEFAEQVKKRSENNEKEPVQKPKKSKGILKTVITVLIILIVSGGLAFGIIYAGADFLGVGFGRGESCVMEIPEGSSTALIAEKLNENGAVKIPLLFRLYSKIKHYDSQYKYGVYTFNNELGYQGIADMLVTKGAVAEQITVMIPESDIDSIAKVLEEKGVCQKSDFINEVQNGEYDYDFIKEIPVDSVYYRLEGYLFPDTYNFYVCEDSAKGARIAVDTMLKNFQKKIEPYKEQIAGGKYSLHELATLASIVQLEAGNTKTASDTDRAKVAAVFFNRLESNEFQTLGSSPTRKYPHGDGRYDTYQCKGLPPGPLCSFNENCLKAVLNPSEEMSGYFYFVTDAQMKFYYNKTLNEHNNIIAKLKKENNWIYEE